jgi:phage tail sheath protein FI
MAEYKHGAYGEINAVGARVSDESQSAIVYIGTAPVHTVEDGAKNVNVPVLINNIAEARRYLGYSDDWASYTLCEAMHVHFEIKGVGPVVMINVLDPATHKKAQKVTTTLTPVDGKLTIAAAEDAILDSVVIKTTGDEPTTKVKGTDYSIVYNIDTKAIVATELTSGALGTAALSVEYNQIDASAVTSSDVIGTTDGLGLNTGTYVMKDVYQKTGYIPSFMVAPGFSSIPTIHAAMYANSVKINTHWDAYMFVDLPITNGDTPITMDTAKTFKNANGYTRANETVYFPIVEGTDGKKYHLSTLAAANFQELLLEQDGIPYRSASNTDCLIIENLYLGEAYRGRIIDDSIVNEKLNKNGIASAAFVGGRWAIWGAHSASYTFPSAADSVNVAETNLMMLYYISNDFQARRMLDVDQPLTPNDIQTIVAEERARLDGLMSIGAIIYYDVALDASLQARADILNGDYLFDFNITTTPLAKSLTAKVTWVDDGFATYFATPEAA